MAAQETFFNYGDNLSSKRLCETFGISNGIGPVSGFGSAKIVDSGGNKVLVIYPYSSGDENSVSSKEEDVDPIRYIVRSRINSHRTTSSMGEEPMQSVIARDGTITRFGQGTITIPIEGDDGSEVFLFAYHEHIPEKVDNPVTLRAIFNNSSYDFYKMYKKSRNPYYPNTDNQYLGNITGNNDDRDPFLRSENSYSYLDDAVAKACTEYANNRNSMVLVGVYGTGIDEINNRTEYFAIVPYQGQGLSDIPYNYAIHNYIIRAINRTERFIFNRLNLNNLSTGEVYDNLSDYLDYMISYKISTVTNSIGTLKKQVESSILPAGSIILWDGISIPEGWEEYTAASGRIVIGYKSGGIIIDSESRNVSAILRNVGETYDPRVVNGVYVIKLKGLDLPKHRHGIGVGVMGNEVDWDKDQPLTVNFDDRLRGYNGNGNFREANIGGIKSGALWTGYNSKSENDPNIEATDSVLELDKLLPAVTLKYIRKKSI